VGLGGRLDATNVIEPQVVVITPVDFDHETLLGRGAAAVFAPQRPEVAEAIKGRARQLGIQVVDAARDWRAGEVEPRDGRYRFVARGPGGARVCAALSLAAIAALDLLGVEASAIEQGLREARWPGRLEAIGRRVWLIYGAMRDKAVDEVARILSPRGASGSADRRGPTPGPHVPVVPLGIVCTRQMHLEGGSSSGSARTGRRPGHSGRRTADGEGKGADWRIDRGLVTIELL